MSDNLNEKIENGSLVGTQIIQSVFGKQVEISLPFTLPCIGSIANAFTQVSIIPITNPPSTIEDFSSINQMIDEGIDLTDSGDRLDTIILPIDSISSESLDGLIIDEDIRGFNDGSFPLLSYVDHGKAGIDKILEVLIKEVKTLISMQSHNYIIEHWNPNQFYYNVDSGDFRFICTSQNPKVYDETSISAFNKNYAAHLLYSLIGAYPAIDGKVFVLCSSLSPENNIIEINGIDQASSKKEEIAERWAVLPEAIRAKILLAFSDNVELSEWIHVLSEHKAKTIVCSNCKKITFSNSRSCFFCKKMLDNSNAQAIFSIINDKQQFEYKIIFGRGTIIYGCNLSPMLAANPFMQIMYSPQKGEYYLKNLSDLPWKVDSNLKSGLVKKDMHFPLISSFTIEIQKLKEFKLKFETLII